MTSSTMQSTLAGRRRRISSAALPVSTVSTACPSASRLKRRPDAICGSSSTTSRVAIVSLDRRREGCRQLDAERGAGAGALADGIGAAAVALGGALDDEQSEARAFDALRQRTRHAVEPSENAFGFV